MVNFLLIPAFSHSYVFTVVAPDGGGGLTVHLLLTQHMTPATLLPLHTPTPVTPGRSEYPRTETAVLGQQREECSTN